MYSILIKKDNKNYQYALDSEGEVFSGTLEEAQAKLTELMQDYPIGKLRVVHNTTVDVNMLIQDVE